MPTMTRARRVSLLVALTVSLSIPAIAQTVSRKKPAAATPPAAAATPAIRPEVDRSPWLFKGSDITPDLNWHFGTLPNGLRYAVRKNGVPPGQVSIRVRIDAGSLYEDDSEQGFAHFMEHLVFRGSAYVADNEAKRTWQRLGATFGSDTNASTTFTQTVFKLDLPSATPETVDESLKILSGMMEAPSFDDKVVNSERPVVLAEQREAPGPQVRYSDAMRATIFAGQPFATRSPIGTTKTLNAATAASLRAFHDRWYRPERAVVIISGDIDPVVFEQLVDKNFASWKGKGANPVDPDFGTPATKQPITGSLVEPGLPTVVSMAVLRPWKFNQDLVLFNQKRLVDQLAVQIINRRLESRARSGGSFIAAGVNLDDIARSTNATTVQIQPVGNNWEQALKDVRAVIADAMTNPPSQAELDREYAEYASAMKNGVDTSRVEAGSAQADNMVSALDIRETVAAPDVSYAILTDAWKKGMFTPASILASTKRIFEGDATRAFVSTPAPDTGAGAKLAAALTADVSKLVTKRTALAAVDFSKLPPLGTPGTVVSREMLPEIEMEKIVFSNGVRLMLYPNSGETNRVYVRVRWGGGYNALPSKKRTPAWAGDLALVQSGIGDLGQEQLDQLMTGRRLGMDFGIDDDAFVLGAVSSPADYQDQLRLLADKLATPGWDPAPIARAKALLSNNFAGLEASPDGVLSRDLEYFLHDRDPRWGMPPKPVVDALTPSSFKSFWQPVLASGSIEVQVFGDVKAEEAIAAVAKTLGALKPRNPVSAEAAPVRFPAHNATPVVRTHNGRPDQAVALIAWPTGGGVDGIAESRKLEVLAQVFSDRLFDRLRTESGASYSPSVQSSWPTGMSAGGRVMAVGQVPPDKTELFFRLSREIAADLAKNPISDDELKRVKEPMIQYVLRSSTGNGFWLNLLGGATYDPRIVEAARSIIIDYNGITATELQAVAAKYLRPDRDWTMEVVPKAVAAKSGLTVAAGQ
ncbi:insulinase family protein [Sphingomonas panacisoli]|uniref:Insulinase family protein n=1 Tax=Sphingomonas panacisoli TaxID=1813879 RepID=A0A5B8LIQ6_9SPHN|nr:M16 family metallopeptidase [Sphingomonas panacisoli]QDZ08157.1 insulinase family protein [Sphingomonas panacisoli]